MFEASEIFEKHYTDYCAQIAGIDPGSIKEILRISQDGDRAVVRFYDRDYLVSKDGILNESGDRPDYLVCVILAKYILLCPNQPHDDPVWVSFKDFKKTSQFLNVNFFTSDTETAIARHFSGRPGDLAKACGKLGGLHQGTEISYDLAFQFQALPRISLLLLFNDADEEFPARCSVLFQRHAELYLDPESLAMTGAYLAGRLKKMA